MAKTSANQGAKEYLKFIGPGTIITVLGFLIAYQFAAPAPSYYNSPQFARRRLLQIW